MPAVFSYSYKIIVQYEFWLIHGGDEENRTPVRNTSTSQSIIAIARECGHHRSGTLGFRVLHHLFSQKQENCCVYLRPSALLTAGDTEGAI